MSLDDMLGSKIFTFGPKSGATGAACSDAAAGPDEPASTTARTAIQRSGRSTSFTFPIFGQVEPRSERAGTRVVQFVIQRRLRRLLVVKRGNVGDANDQAVFCEEPGHRLPPRLRAGRVQ